MLEESPSNDPLNRKFSGIGTRISKAVRRPRLAVAAVLLVMLCAYGVAWRRPPGFEEPLKQNALWPGSPSIYSFPLDEKMFADGPRGSALFLRGPVKLVYPDGSFRWTMGAGVYGYIDDRRITLGMPDF